MPRAIPIRYNGKDFLTRRALAEHLAAITGRSWSSWNKWLRQFNDNAERVIAHASTAKLTNQNFASRAKLAQHLAEVTGCPPNRCQYWLRQFNDNTERVIAHASTASEHAERIPAILVTVGGKTFASRASFARYLHTNYGVATGTAENWFSIKHLSPEQCLERARAWRKKHWKPRQFEGEVMLFGWYFNSPRALCTYYGIPYHGFLTEWRARTPGTPVHRLPAVMRTIAQLWELGRLDERNRQPPLIEARLPKSCLPTNTTIDETALTAYERATLDCLQPVDARTPRRDGLAWLARMRQRAVS